MHIYLPSCRSSITIAVLVVICSALTGGLAAYQNDWDGPLFVMCNKRQGEALYRVQSVHSNIKGDRRWMWQCKQIVSGVTLECESWTDYKYGYGIDFEFKCDDNQAILSGVKSVHSNPAEDRRWKFYCCKSDRFCPKQCRWSNYINNWGGYMHYIAPHIRIFTGVKSVYDPIKK